jgi:hypothetical protein
MGTIFHTSSCGLDVPYVDHEETEAFLHMAFREVHIRYLIPNRAVKPIFNSFLPRSCRMRTCEVGWREWTSTTSCLSKVKCWRCHENQELVSLSAPCHSRPTNNIFNSRLVPPLYSLFRPIFPHPFGRPDLIHSNNQTSWPCSEFWRSDQRTTNIVNKDLFWRVAFDLMINEQLNPLRCHSIN